MGFVKEGLLSDKTELKEADDSADEQPRNINEELSKS